MLAFVALLFAALTPGVLVTLPPRSSKLTVALTHGVVFALVYQFTRQAASMMLTGGREGAKDTHTCPEGKHKNTKGECVADEPEK
jgi:hypothetical protein